MSLAFKLPDDSTDLAQALEDIEPQAPKAIKPLLLQAARDIRRFKELAERAAISLETVASWRAGQMDSQSRHDEIATAVRKTIAEVVAQLRAQA